MRTTHRILNTQGLTRQRRGYEHVGESTKSAHKWSVSDGPVDETNWFSSFVEATIYRRPYKNEDQDSHNLYGG
jgi:hypothetical protein